MKVLVAGAKGMVGRAVIDECKTQGDEVFAYDHTSLDISDLSLIQRELATIKPEAVFNCAAWTDVDGCESDPAKASAVNAGGPENLALASRSVGAVLVTISTDYVFDGRKDGFYTQRDDPNPTSAYGVAKLAGERRAQVASARTIIVRSGFIYGPGGRNFLSTVAARLQQEELVGAIADAWGTPTYAAHLATRLRELAHLDLPGIYHVVNSGAGASYEDFASLLAESLGKRAELVHGVRSDTMNRPAPRPRNCRLKCLVSTAIGLSPLPDWREGIREFLALFQSSGAIN